MSTQRTAGPSAFDVSGKVALITGAGRGLGAATASLLAQRGAIVVIAERDIAAGQSTAASLPGGRGHAVECDVTDASSVDAAADWARTKFGSIDIVIANAGILGGGATVRSLARGQAESVISVNVIGVLNTVRATIEDVIASQGHYVFISSVFAYMNGAGAVPYAMSKAAVEQLGRGLGVELAMHGATVTTAYFSLIDTDMVRDGVEGDPHLMTLLSASPKFMLKKITPLQASTALVDAITVRREAVMVPARWRPISSLRGILGPVVDGKFRRDSTVRSALSSLEARLPHPLQP